MDGTTTEQAIADVRSYIDDRQGRRWDRQQVVRALHSALSSCLERYARAGGDRFEREIEVTTDGADGVSLVAYEPIAIRRVLAVTSSGTAPIHGADPGLRGSYDTQSRDLIIRYVPHPLLPQDDTDPLVSSLAGDQRPWPAFERWVCMRAGLELGITDKDQRDDLKEAEAALRVERCWTPNGSRARCPGRARHRSRWCARYASFGSRPSTA